VPSQYAKDAKAAGLDIMTWTLERSGRIREEVLPTQSFLLLSDHAGCPEERRRHHGHTGRAGTTGGHSRHLLRLVRNRQLLCELHGSEVVGQC
jgi:hypothetical protein